MLQKKQINKMATIQGYDTIDDGLYQEMKFFYHSGRIYRRDPISARGYSIVRNPDRYVTVRDGTTNNRTNYDFGFSSHAVDDVSCGTAHTLLATQDGVYAAGSNFTGLTGMGTESGTTNPFGYRHGREICICRVGCNIRHRRTR